MILMKVFFKLSSPSEIPGGLREIQIYSPLHSAISLSDFPLFFNICLRTQNVVCTWCDTLMITWRTLKSMLRLASYFPT